jgi:NAD(P)-dependent dehydrogenase (short-subunit alcohol dehydrogenase family)
MMTQNLSGRIALITGASRGLGRAAAIKLAEKGARIIVHHGGSSEEAHSVLEEIRSGGGQADAIAGDLSTGGGAMLVAKKVKQFAGVDRIDILVLNAGIAEPSPLADQSVENFDRHFAINVRAPYFLVQQLLPLLQDGSSVIFMSAAAARIAIEGISVYSATKGAINVLTRNFAHELGPRGIRVNAIVPGAIETEMGKVMMSTEEGREYIKDIQALKRIGQPDDIADVVLFLSSDQSRWVTGALIDASGGSRL